MVETDLRGQVSEGTNGYSLNDVCEELLKLVVLEIYYPLVINTLLRFVGFATPKGEVYKKLVYEGELQEGEHKNVGEGSQ